MPYLIAIPLAVITCLIGYSLPFYKAQDFYGMLLVMLAGGYMGLAANDGRRHVMVIELAVALGFIALAMMGMWKWPLLIAFGYFLQAVWNLLHYPLKVGARGKPWYPVAQVVFDALVGAFIYLHLFR